VRADSLQYLRCPECSGELELQPLQHEREHVVSGSVVCSGCGARYAVTGGIPRFNRRLGELEAVASTFSHEWDAHHRGTLEDETLFGRTEAEDWALFEAATGLSGAEVAGMVVLDAGCGSGRLTRQIAEHGAQAVVGLDVSDSVNGVFARTREVANLHVVQGNLLDAPVGAMFDLVWSNGVIHHTPDAAAAFRALTRHVRPGGLLYVWVYPNRINPFRWTKAALDHVGLRRLSPPAIMRLARTISYPSLAGLEAYRLVRRLPGLTPRGAWGRSTVRRRSLRELQLTWNDALAPPWNSWHTDDEVMGWFRDAGFTDVSALDERKVGVRGRAPLDRMACRSERRACPGVV
jgi:SAM-dependent methyltransferase/uncharacterized protein YbaR (Trm112 family)